MKTLPDFPNLDHLRQQAKDLLPHLRAGRASATLSDAQTLVAEQYGFRTWTDLKDEVDRRTAATPTAAATAAAIADTFALGTPQGPLVALERQWAGQAWTLDTDGGRWMARRLFDWFDECRVEAEVLLAESAATVGIETPRPVRSKSGAVVATLGDERWRVYEMVPVGPEPSTPADPRHAAAAGRILGKVHRLRLPAPEPVQSWLTQLRSEAGWREVHRIAEAEGKAWAPRLAEAIPTIVEVSGIVEPVDADQETVLSACHYAPNAFRTAGPDDLVVMSWEHAGAMPLRWDFGGAVAAWSGGVPGRVNAGAARALMGGYAEEADVPRPLDLGIFSAWVCGNLSWLISRIRIALREPDAEERELADRAVPWLLGRPASRGHLEEVLDALR